MANMIKNITLLKASEAAQLPKNIFICQPSENYEFNLGKAEHQVSFKGICCWWAIPDQPGQFGDRTAPACWDNPDKLSNYFIIEAINSVRPVLVLDTIEGDLYTEVELFGETWIKISDTQLLCKNAIGNYYYNDNIHAGSDYETSKIKEYIQAWANRKGIKIDE